MPGMCEHKNPWLAVAASATMLIATGCTHKAAQFQDSLAPFTYTRNVSVGLVAHAKRSLGAADVNTLDVSYTALEEKGNAYASFMVEAVSATSFDESRNQKYADDFQAAIDVFNKSYATLMATQQRMIASAWVPSFSQSLQKAWNQYDGAIAKMAPQQKLDLVNTLKHDTVWPNYEDIATEPLPSSRP
jgi:hypothetical protein